MLQISLLYMLIEQLVRHRCPAPRELGRHDGPAVRSTYEAKKFCGLSVVAISKQTSPSFFALEAEQDALII